MTKEEAKKKYADDLGDDLLVGLDYKSVEVEKLEFDPNDFTHMLDGITNFSCDDLKSLAVENEKTKP